jgi:hypothetical protein
MSMHSPGACLVVTLIALLGVPALSGCATSASKLAKSSITHYDDCAKQTTSFVAMAACGKQRREADCGSANACTNTGNAVVQYADALAKSVSNREMSEAEAQRRFAEFKMGVISARNRDLAIMDAGAAASGPTVCNRVGNIVTCN